MFHVFSEKCALNSLAKKFKNYVADQSGYNSNHEIRDCKNILNGESQALSVAIASTKFPHQKV